jgi:hypothetical protein
MTNIVTQSIVAPIMTDTANSIMWTLEENGVNVVWSEERGKEYGNREYLSSAKSLLCWA